MTQERRPIGKILLDRQAIAKSELDAALSAQARDGGHLLSRLTEDGIIDELEALRALADQLGVPAIDLGQVCIDLRALEIVPREIAEIHRILPIVVQGDRVLLAMADPQDRRALDELEFVTGKRVFPYATLAAPLARVIREAYESAARGERWYIGPRCPDDVRRRAGAPAPAPAPAAPESEPPPASVVADDRVARAAAHDELSDAFGSSVMAELSQLGAHPEAESHRPPEDGARRTVLVVDDEVEVRRMLTRLFSDRGFRVIAADRGLTALRLVKERSPDVIVLDAMLPEVHGFDIAKRIRGSRKYGHIPIVMISAYYRGWRYEEDVRAAYGVTAFIEKPFKMADILAAVDGALARVDGRPVHDPQPDTSGEAEQALVAGIAAYKAGDVETAIGHLRRGVEIDPLAHRLHFQLGLLLGKRGQIFEAILALEKALETSPRHFQALKNLAVLYQKAGFRNQAIECWERALAHSPDEATRHTIKQHLLELL